MRRREGHVGQGGQSRAGKSVVKDGSARARQSTGPDERKVVVPSPVGQKGYTGNPGGRPKALKEIERMLNEEHRTVDNMRAVYARLKFLALGEPVEVTFRGAVVRIDLKADPAFMKLYLERVVGPVKDLDDLDELLKDAPPEAIEFLRGLVH